jgi:hypothetical protein
MKNHAAVEAGRNDFEACFDAPGGKHDRSLRRSRRGSQGNVQGKCPTYLASQNAIAFDYDANLDVPEEAEKIVMSSQSQTTNANTASKSIRKFVKLNPPVEKHHSSRPR